MTPAAAILAAMATSVRSAAATIAGLLLAVAVLAAALPDGLSPWTAGLRHSLRTWWPAWAAVSSLTLALAGRLLSVPRELPTDHDHSGLTVGLLLLLEPLLHLAVLALCAGFASRFGSEALLPAGWQRPAPTAAFATRVLVLAMLAPVCEEYFFRGRLLPWLLPRLGPVSAVSLSACAFAVAHGDVVQAVVALPIGLLLGTMRVAGADLGACMLAHAVHNGLFLIGGAGLIALPWIGPAMAGLGALLTASPPSPGSTISGRDRRRCVVSCSWCCSPGAASPSPRRSTASSPTAAG